MMEQPTSSVRGPWLKNAFVLVVFFLVAIAAVKLMAERRQRIADTPPASLSELFPIPDEPFEPEPPLPPEPGHVDDPPARQRFARLMAGLKPFDDPYDQIAVFDAIIDECGKSPDRSVRAGVGVVMLLKAGRVLDRRQLAHLYDEILMRARSMPPPHSEIADVWARTGKALLQVRRVNRQRALDLLLEQEGGSDDAVLRRAFLRARLARVEEEDDRLRRIELSAILIARIVQKHDLTDAAVGAMFKKTLSLRLAAARTMEEVAAACDEALSASGTEASPALKSMIIDTVSKSLYYDSPGEDAEALAKYLIERFGARSDPEVEQVYFSTLEKLFNRTGPFVEKVACYDRAIALAGDKGLSAALPWLFRQKMAVVVSRVSPIFVPGVSIVPAVRRAPVSGELADAKERLEKADAMDVPDQARAEYDEIIRLFQDSPDENVRAVALKAYLGKIDLGPEPWDRLALCDQAIAKFGGDKKVFAISPYLNPFTSVLNRKSEILLDKSPYIIHYNRVIAESGDRREAAEAMMEKAKHIFKREDEDAIYDEIIGWFKESYRPSEQQMVVKCIKKKAQRRYRTEEKMPLLFSIVDAYYYCQNASLRREVTDAIKDVILNSRHPFASTPEQNDDVESNRLRVMLIDAAEDEGDMVQFLSSLKLCARSPEEGRAILNWMTSRFYGSRNYRVKHYVDEAFSEKAWIASGGYSNARSYNATISDFRAGRNNVDRRKLREASVGKVRLTRNPEEKLRIWNEYLELTGPKHNMEDLFKKGELLDLTGRDSLPVYEEVIAMGKNDRRRFRPSLVVRALSRKCDLLSAPEEKLAILDEIIILCRSGMGDVSCYGEEHKAAIVRKSELLGDASIKAAYFREVVDWFRSSTGRQAEALVMDSLNELAEMADEPGEKIRLYTELIETPKSALYDKPRKMVQDAYRRLVELAPTREEKIRIYEKFFQFFNEDESPLNRWDLSNDKRQYDALIKTQ